MFCHLNYPCLFTSQNVNIDSQFTFSASAHYVTQHERERGRHIFAGLFPLAENIAQGPSLYQVNLVNEEHKCQRRPGKPSVNTPGKLSRIYGGQQRRIKIGGKASHSTDSTEPPPIEVDSGREKRSSSSQDELLTVANNVFTNCAMQAIAINECENDFRENVWPQMLEAMLTEGANRAGDLGAYMNVCLESLNIE